MVVRRGEWGGRLLAAPADPGTQEVRGALATGMQRRAGRLLRRDAEDGVLEPGLEAGREGAEPVEGARGG